MCGIAGRINHKTGRAADADDLDAMCARMGHRGPDERGTYLDGPLALGMQRLSIIDPDGGAQPIFNESGDVVVVFNGEIYNYKELRRDLLARRHRFRTRGDTEVIVHLYEEHGPALAEKLAGMFAIAIYDRNKGRLLLIRDRVGKKPLFTCETREGLLFASELKCLLDQPDFSPRLHEPALHEFLCLGYVPGPTTILSGVRQVPPGGWLEIDERGVRAGRYWSLNVSEDEPADEAQAAERVRDLFRTAVSRRLVADVPIGIYLSGGCDSIAVLATAAEVGGGLHTAYTAEFCERTYDETSLAARAAREFSVPHEVVECRPQDLAENFEPLVYHADNLLANPAMIPTFLLARRAKGRLKVILGGGGGDELFFGYPTYDADILAGYLNRLPNGCLNAAAALTRRFVPVSFEKLSFSYKVSKLLEGARYDRDKAHHWWRTVFTDEGRRRLFAPRDDFPDTYRAYRDSLRARSERSPLSRANAADFEVWWRDMGLYLADTVNMAHGIEARLPFMDHELIEYVYRLPVRLRYRRGQVKRLFKLAMRGVLPEWVLREKKAGFHVPLAPWFKTELQGFLRDALHRDRVESIGYFDPSEIDRLLDEHVRQKADNSYMLWNLACFVKWHELFLQGGHRRYASARREEVCV